MLKTFEITEKLIVGSWVLEECGRYFTGRRRTLQTTDSNEVYQVECAFTNNRSTAVVAFISRNNATSPATNIWVLLNGMAKPMRHKKGGEWDVEFELDEYTDCGAVVCLYFLIDFDPVIKKEQVHVIKHLSDLWKTKTLADVAFNVGSTTIQAHTQIIASGSPVLAAMFQNNFREGADRVAEIKEVGPKVFEKLLGFIYTGDAQIDNRETASGLLRAAHMYCVEELKYECSNFLSRNITMDKACRYLILSHIYGANILYDATLDFMVKNSREICSRTDWMELIKKYPELSFVAMQRISKQELSCHMPKVSPKDLKTSKTSR